MRRSYSVPLILTMIMAVLMVLLPVQQAMGLTEILTPIKPINLLSPTVTSVSPSSGSTAGDTSVTIAGTNLTGASAVTFGTVAGTIVSINSGASITATSPAGSAGAVDVTVTTAFGASATSSADQFTYIAPLTGIIPKTIPGLNQNLLNATHLVISAPATAVSGTPFSFTVTAQTLLNTIATGYTGTVSFTSDDQAASLPPFRTLTNGTGTFNAIMKTVGQQTITATDANDPSISGSTNIQVSTAGTTPPASGQIVLHFHIGSTDSDINGQAQPLDTAPIISNGRTFLPIKFVAGPLGAKTSWDPSQQMVTVTLGSTTLQLWIGKNTAMVNGVSTPIDPGNPDVTPMIANGRTMLPLAFIAANLGCKVLWDANANAVTYMPVRPALYIDPDSLISLGSNSVMPQ